MNYRVHLQEAESLLKEKHYAACVQKCSAIFEAAFKEVYQRYIANIENMVEKKEIQRIEEEIGKNQRTFQRFGFGELVGLARKAKLFERLSEILKHDLDRINTINFGSLVDIRNRVTHQGGEVQEIDAEIFLTGLRAFLLDTQLMEPVLSLVQICPKCGNKTSEGAKHCPHCGADLEKSEQSLSCPSCKGSVMPDWTLCPKCGARLRPEVRNCPQCGGKVQSDWKLCPFCGASMGAEDEPKAAGEKAKASEREPQQKPEPIPEPKPEPIPEPKPEPIPPPVPMPRLSQYKFIAIGIFLMLLVIAAGLHFVPNRAGKKVELGKTGPSSHAKIAASNPSHAQSGAQARKPTPAPAPGTYRYGMVCLKNMSGVPIHYFFRWGDSGEWETREIDPGASHWHSWEYDRGSRVSPDLHVKFDATLNGGDMKQFVLERYAATARECGLGKSYDFVSVGNTVDLKAEK